MVSHPTLDKIIRNNLQLIGQDVRKVLILFEETVYSLGDTCIRFDYLKYIKWYFPNASIHINAGFERKSLFFSTLLMHNPHIDSISGVPRKQIDFISYDVVFCVSYTEQDILDTLYDKYGDEIEDDRFKVAFFSFSRVLMARLKDTTDVFPMHGQLMEFINLSMNANTRKLYMTPEERAWGDRWLESKGVKDGDRLFILLDSASLKSKLIHISVFFEFLEFLLSVDGGKVLIFDEKKVGKEAFYAEWLGEDECNEKMIFSDDLSLRQDLSLIASSYTDLVFGPCSGLMHCASQMYNHYLESGVCSKEKIPLMMTYTGTYPPREPGAGFWWKNSPLMNCLLVTEVREAEGVQRRKKMIVLDELAPEEQESYSQFPCSEYTAGMFIDFVRAKLQGV